MSRAEITPCASQLNRAASNQLTQKSPIMDSGSMHLDVPENGITVNPCGADHVPVFWQNGPKPGFGLSKVDPSRPPLWQNEPKPGFGLPQDGQAPGVLAERTQPGSGRQNLDRAKVLTLSR
jgi:hypothetical protein